MRVHSCELRGLIPEVSGHNIDEVRRHSREVRRYSGEVNGQQLGERI